MGEGEPEASPRKPLSVGLERFTPIVLPGGRVREGFRRNSYLDLGRTLLDWVYRRMGGERVVAFKPNGKWGQESQEKGIQYLRYYGDHRYEGKTDTRYHLPLPFAHCPFLRSPIPIGGIKH